MTKLKFITLLAALCSTLAVHAQTMKASVIPIDKGEMWWGAATSLGTKAPLVEASLNLITDNKANQAVPFMVSSYGRYIWSDAPFNFKISGGQITIESPKEVVKVEKAGKNLREAYVVAASKHFKGNGQLPPEEFFVLPQYNTWIELNHNQNQADIEAYADGILACGLPAGILMIDNTWQRYHGNWNFKAEKFSDPKGMVDRLHAKGFKVMLWVSPFISADSQDAKELFKKGYLIKDKAHPEETALIRWWDGASACFDFTNPEVFAYFTNELKRLQADYGIDGFKFDAGDFYFYDPSTQISHKADALPPDHAEAWCRLGMQFPYNEFRASWKMQGEPLVQRLNDKDYSWAAIQTLIPEMINAGLMGHPYTCPDMIGGGQWGSFENMDYSKIDQNLIVRSAQVHALMPMMQFSVAPWRILDKEHLEYCVAAAKLHRKMAPYIMELAREASKTGEPIIRHMEYMFPHKGFVDCNDQFMLGSQYLVAPVLSEDGKRTVRLPRGQWIDDTGKKFRGPLVMEITVEPGRLPYYTKAK